MESAVAFKEFKPRNLGRYPRLDTVLMVEKAIRKAYGEKTVTQIWKGLPKKVMWTTYITIVDYLFYSGKILIDNDKCIIWTWNPKLLEQVKRFGVEV
ncbi:TPA: hypothetical protein HA244_05800 [Candidatus Micrarchaeota archaeon]|nr:hypothetical protein [Candidatus Micrarchaeota archaeon]